MSSRTKEAIFAMRSAVAIYDLMMVNHIATMPGTPAPTFFRILKAIFKLHTIFPIWVPHLLTQEQKHSTLELALQLS